MADQDVSKTTIPQQFNDLLKDARAEEATDIHLDGLKDGSFQLRTRVDGQLQSKEVLSEEDGTRLLKQIRVHSQLGIQDIPHPLEGRISWNWEGIKYGIRITITPTMENISVHLRFLTPPKKILETEQLGITHENMKIIRGVLRRKKGLIILAGPTGAGKTTTMYSLVSQLDLKHSLTVSIEDPVEYSLQYVRQVQVDEESGLDMHEGLLTLLRMDPDVIMVGELRDTDSTLTAIQAAASGHFVFGTLHGGSPHMAMATLRFLGAPNHLLGNTLRLIIVQDLVRRLCTICATNRSLTEKEKSLFQEEGMEPPDELYEPKGCDTCGNYGFRGRVGLFQLMPVDEEVGVAIAEGGAPHEINRMMVEREVASLFKDGLKKVDRHVTSLSEILHLYSGKQDVNDL